MVLQPTPVHRIADFSVCEHDSASAPPGGALSLSSGEQHERYPALFSIPVTVPVLPSLGTDVGR